MLRKESELPKVSCSILPAIKPKKWQSKILIRQRHRYLDTAWLTDTVQFSVSFIGNKFTVMQPEN